jgi:hypothetical protein
MTVTREITRAAFEERLVHFLAALKDFQDKHYGEHYSCLKAPTFTIERGSKYIRVVETRPSQRSVYCFLDYQGNIYKSESWKKPAKHIRGSIFHPNFDLGRALTTYGAIYLK